MRFLTLQVCLWGLLCAVACQSAVESDQAAVETDQVEVESDAPVNVIVPIITKPGEAHLAPAVLPAIFPAKYEGEKKTFKLPSSFDEYVVGGGGRYLIFYLKKLQHIAIFDVSAAKIVKYLSVGPDDISFAASANKLVVLFREQKLIQRYNLLTFEKEQTNTLYGGETIKRIVMGAASNGPLLCERATEGPPLFLDLDTLEPSAINLEWPSNFQFTNIVNVSANGRVFGFGSTDTRRMTNIILNGNRGRFHQITSPDGGPLIPNPDGSQLFSSDRVQNDELYLIDSEHSFSGIPAVHGGFYLTFDSENMMFYSEDDTLLMTIPGIKNKSSKVVSTNRAGNVFLRMCFLPSAHVLAYLPVTNDRIDLYRVNLDDAADELDVDYFYVSSQPKNKAERGEKYEYAVKIKSKQGAVKYRVDSGPEGMTVSPEGIVQWQVPNNYAADKADVILSFTDAENQQRFQTFQLAIRGKLAEGVATDKLTAENNVISTALSGNATAQFEGKKQEIKLPSTLLNLAIGDNGRYLFLHLNNLQQLAIFDTSKFAIVGYLPIASNDILITADSRYLFVVYPEQNLIQRWVLSSFRSDQVISSPFNGTISRIDMRRSSLGNVIVVAGNLTNPNSIMFIDPHSMKPVDLPLQEKIQQVKQLDKDNNKTERSSNYSYLVDIPAVQPGFSISVFRSGPGKQVRRPNLNIKDIPFAALDEVDTSLSQMFSERMPLIPFSKRYSYIPSANVLVQVPNSRDRLILHQIDTKRLLKKSRIDYFFIASFPPLSAQSGELWQYQIVARSKNDGLQYELTPGSPQGMTISSTGLVSWNVPEQYPLNKVNLTILVKDNSGKEIKHSFALPIR